MDRITALSMLLGRPLLVEKRALEVMISIASRGEFFEGARLNALEAREGAPLKNARAATVRGRTAVIPVTGPLVRHADMFDEISGATSYGALRKDLQAALDDPNVAEVVWAFHTPGGEVTGCQELADAIFAARAQKRQLAYIDGMACSAGYWLASACDEIVIAPTGEAGSIGVMLGWLDDTGAMEQAGIKEIRFTSSQSPNKNPDPQTDAGRAQYQKLVDDLAAVFVAGVARNRGVTEAQVLEHFGQGGVFVGEHAVAARLADRIGNFEAVLADLAKRQQEKTMTYAKMLGLGDDATAEQVGERIQALAKFEARAVSALGAADAEDALGKMAAAADALKELPGVRAELAAVRVASTQRSLRDVLASGLREHRLSLGAIQQKLPTLLADEKAGAALKEQFSALADVTEEAVLGVATTAPASATDLRVITAWVGALEPRVAEPAREPQRRDDEETAALSAVDREVASSLGISEETTKEYGGVRSADDLKKKSTKRAVARTSKEA